MTKIVLNKRIGLVLLLVLPFVVFCFGSNNGNKTSENQYIIDKIIPSSAIIKIDGKRVKHGSIFSGNDNIEMPSNACIAVRKLAEDEKPVIKGAKLAKLKDKTFDNYLKQLNSKGSNSLEAIKNYLNEDTWVMISDTAYIQFPAALSMEEFIIFRSIPKYIEYKPFFNYENQIITVTKSDLMNIGIYNDNDSIMQFQVEVHDSKGSTFVTNSLKIELISIK